MKLSNPIFETQFDLLPAEQQLVDFLMSENCPYYFQDSGYNNEYSWVHVMMRRNKENKPVSGDVNSEIYPLAESLFKRFCSKNNIVPKVILRAAVNATGYSQKKHGFIHVDHSQFENYNFIMYLNDVGGNTCIFDNKDNLIYEIKPAKNKVAIFKDQPHAQAFCDLDKYRFVLIFTFIAEQTHD